MGTGLVLYRPMRNVVKSAGLAALLAICGLSQPAHAGLGGDLNEVEEDRRTLAGVMKSSVSHGSYTVFEISTPSRTVREFATSSGVIFAVSWQGVNHPDLTRLLGSYYGEFSGANAPKTIAEGRVRRAHQQLQTPNLVFERAGHLRDVRGRAYVQPLPEGVSADEIR